jgi:putative tributyrin esterase
MKFLRSTLGLLLVLAASVSITAQTPRPSPTPLTIKGTGNYARPNEERLKSSLMGREMPYRVILPTGYSSRSQERFPVIYLLHGLTGSHRNWTDLSSLGIYAQAYKVIIVTPEGANGWYTDSVASPSDKFESYIIQELIPEIEKKYRVIPARDKRAIAGLSMGGYGALKFGLKYPDKFAVAGSFSGALGAASFTEREIPGAIGKTIDGIFGPAGSETRKSNDIFGMIRSMTPESMKAIPFLYLDCGTEDFLFANNRQFVDLLVEKKVPHEFRQLPGAHNWKYWDRQVQEFLRVADRAFMSGSTAR